MDKTLYYKNNRGDIIDSDKIEQAFYIVSGKHRYEDEPGYLRFLYKLLGKSIVAIAKPDVQSLLAGNSKIMAIKLYREENNCSLLDAKEAVEKMIAELF